MSSGNFLDAFYEADDGSVTAIKIQPETAAAAFSPGGTNVIPSGDNASGITRVGGSRRAYGRKARQVRITSSSPPTGYKSPSTITLPVLTRAAYNAITLSSTVTYLGATWTVSGKSSEAGRF